MRSGISAILLSTGRKIQRFKPESSFIFLPVSSQCTSMRDVTPYPLAGHGQQYSLEKMDMQVNPEDVHAFLYFRHVATIVMWGMSCIYKPRRLNPELGLWPSEMAQQNV